MGRGMGRRKGKQKYSPQNSKESKQTCSFSFPLAFDAHNI